MGIPSIFHDHMWGHGLYGQLLDFPYKDGVAGSSPVPPTFCLSTSLPQKGMIYKDGVAGSSPVPPTQKTLYLGFFVSLYRVYGAFALLYGIRDWFWCSCGAVGNSSIGVIISSKSSATSSCAVGIRWLNSFMKPSFILSSINDINHLQRFFGAPTPLHPRLYRMQIGTDFGCDHSLAHQPAGLQRPGGRQPARHHPFNLFVQQPAYVFSLVSLPFVRPAPPSPAHSWFGQVRVKTGWRAGFLAKSACAVPGKEIHYSGAL